MFDDYSKYFAPLFDPDAKTKTHDEVFRLECKKAFDMGVRFVIKAK